MHTYLYAAKYHFLILTFNSQKERNETVKKQLRTLSFCVQAVPAAPRKLRKSCLRMNFGNCFVPPLSSTSQKSLTVGKHILAM